MAKWLIIGGLWLHDISKTSKWQFFSIKNESYFDEDEKLLSNNFIFHPTCKIIEIIT